MAFPPKPPMLLHHYGELLGTVVSYSYETPWASGRLEPVSAERYSQYARAYAFLNEIETWPDDEADARYDSELAARNISVEVVERYWSGWTVTMHDGSRHEVSMLIIDETMIVSWRW